MKQWIVKEHYDNQKDILSLLLKNRDVSDTDKEAFLNPPPVTEYIKKLPADFKEALKKARTEILEVVKNRQPIIIHGDYDADGICATAILYKTLTETLNYSQVACFIPNRFDQGYGLSLESVKEIVKLVETRFHSKGGLIITVDCGITAEASVVDYVKELGFKLILTDHHQKKETLPNADVVLWNDGMVGAGVSMVLSIILGQRDVNLLSLAGIATVTDLAVLKGFNRALVKKSLEVLNTTPPAGLKCLLDHSGRRDGEITVHDLGYVIGPRLNASGRLESALESLNLLLENDPREAAEIAQRLNSVNNDRQMMTQKMFDLANGLCTPNSLESILITSSSDYHEGVIGLVAGKLTQKYYRPSITISINGELAKGSARSVPGVNIIEMLRTFEDRFVGLGGHPMAAGFSIRKEGLEAFISDFTAYSRNFIAKELLIPHINIDLEIPLSFITEDLLNKVEQLKPYGIGNPEPLYLSRNVGIAGTSLVGKEGSHLSLRLFDGQTTYKGILFDAKNLGVTGFELGTTLDIVYTASVNKYNGNTSVDLIIKDFEIR